MHCARSSPLPILLGLLSLGVQAQEWPVRVLAQRDLHVPRQVHAADLDGDGDLDLITSGALERPFVQLHENLGEGAAWALRTPIDSIPFRSWLVYTAVADLDVDGDMDLVVGPRQESASNGFFRNDGAWQFTWTPAIGVPPVGDLGPDATVADMDGDAWPDLVMADADGAGIVYDPGSPAGPTFHQLPWEHPIAQLIVLDLDGDGDQDLVARETYEFGEWTNDLVGALNNNDGTFTTWSVLVGTEGARDLHAADMDGDGLADVVAAPDGWHRNTGGTLAAVTPLALEAEELLPVDADDDGDPDLLGFGEDEVRLWTNDGNGAFTPGPVLAPGVRATQVVEEAFADIDGNGHIDLVGMRSSGVLGWAPATEQDVSHFTKVSRSFDEVKDLAVGDADGDGTDDLLFASFSRCGWFDVVGTTGPVPPHTLSLWSGASAVPMDVDGDGDLDALAHDRTLLNDGSGQLIPVPNIGAPIDGSTRYNYMDVDNDGRLDLVRAAVTDLVLHYGPANTWSEPVVLGDFASNPPHAALAADLNGDAWPDIIAFSPGNSCDAGSNGHVYLGAGDGAFHPAHCPSGLFGLQPGPRTIFLRDMDGDGDTDILNASFIDLSWSANDGTGHFGPMQELLPDIRVVSGCLADLDNDGLEDLCYYSEIGADGEGVFITLQGPGPSFSAPVRVSTLDCENLLALDIDQDGRRDVVASRSMPPFFYEVIAFMNDLPTGMAAVRVPGATLEAAPVPMGTATVVRWSADAGPEARMHLLDALGRTVRVLPMPAGRSLRLERDGLPAGAYLLHVRGSGMPVQPLRLVME